MKRGGPSCIISTSCNLRRIISTQCYPRRLMGLLRICHNTACRETCRAATCLGLRVAGGFFGVMKLSGIVALLDSGKGPFTHDLRTTHKRQVCLHLLPRWRSLRVPENVSTSLFEEYPGHSWPRLAWYRSLSRNIPPKCDTRLDSAIGVC